MRTLLAIVCLAISTISSPASAQSLRLSVDSSLGEALEERVVSSLRPHQEAMARCFSNAGPATWVLKLALDADGRVVGGAVDGQPDLGTCLVRAVGSVQLPREFAPAVTVRVELAVTGLLGALGADSNGSSNGFGGLGLRTTGPGGGGTGEGTIGLGASPENGLGSGMGGGMRGTTTRNVTPRVRAGSVVVQGSLSREIIRRVIRRHSSAMRYCYERELVRRPELEGSVVLRFIIAGDGNVQTTATEDVDAGMEAVAACIARQARRWQFPEPAGGGIVVVRYPFQFRPG